MFNFFLCTSFYEPLHHAKKSMQGISFHQQAPKFPQMHLYVPHHLLLSHLMNLPPRHQLMNYFSQSIRSVFNDFFSLIRFLQVNLKGLITLLVLWFSQTLNFFSSRLLITTTLIRDLIFATQRQAIFVLLRMKKF